MKSNNVTTTLLVSLMNSDKYQNMSTMRTLKTKHVKTFIKGAVPTLKGWLYENKWFSMTKWMRRVLKFTATEYKVYMRYQCYLEMQKYAVKEKKPTHNLLLLVALQ